MGGGEVRGRRLHAQRITHHTLKKPGDVVRWLGAVQAQDYHGSLWALGLRLPDATVTDIERAIAEKEFIRTSFMRGTVHLLPPEDIRWMLRLMAPRIRSLINNTARSHKLGLTEEIYEKSNVVIADALAGGNALTRPELGVVLTRAGIDASGLRGALIPQRALADGVICYATRRGGKSMLVLLEEWAPPGAMLEGDDALAEFARRYFRSHGPATDRDYSWWSGLTLTDARRSLAMIDREFAHEIIDGETFRFSASEGAPTDIAGMAHLLPNYDEYIVGYKNRDVVFDPSHAKRLDARGNILFNHTIAIGGQIVGTWKRIVKKGGVRVVPDLFRALKPAERGALAEAVERYGRFLEMPADC
ncbi:MAG: winged helix DNA-binding protein [Chlorobi bacterium]|nr:winged helix DNA-binding protein [Chlorobiota bacterium]